MFEQLNKVELAGRVGSVRVSVIGEKKLARVTLATSQIFRDAQGTIVEEVVWHNVAVWEKNFKGDVDTIAKGDALHVIGRFRNQRYINADGEDKYFPEVLASEAEKIIE